MNTLFNILFFSSIVFSQIRVAVRNQIVEAPAQAAVLAEARAAAAKVVVTLKRRALRKKVVLVEDLVQALVVDRSLTLPKSLRLLRR